MTDLVERELELDSPPDLAWAALTDPEWLALWLADAVELECVPGGPARFTAGDEVREGWVEEVSPPHAEPDGRGRLTFWWTRGEEPASRVELELSPRPDGGTRLRVTETRPLELLDLVGVPLPGAGSSRRGPALLAA